MNKVKINTGLASVVLLACLFSGWQTLLIVSILMFLFCEIDEGLKNFAVKVITFYLAITLLGALWGLINDGVEVVFNTIRGLVSFINSYLSVDRMISLANINKYFFNPVTSLLGLANSLISYGIGFAKVMFIVYTLTNKKSKDGFISRTIGKYVDMAVAFVRNFNVQAQPQQAPVNVAPQMPANNQYPSDQTGV